MHSILINNQEHFKFDLLNTIACISHLVTGKNPSIKRGLIDGLNYGLNVPDTKEVVYKNRLEILVHMGITNGTIVIPYQTHSCNIEILTKANAGDVFNNVDAIITNEKNIVIGTLSADCVPILIVDPIKGVIACVHAGWKGTAAEIGKKTIAKMNESFGCQPQNMIAGIGPSISQENYEVGYEVSKHFGDDCLIDAPNNKKCVDLWKENKNQLIAAGLLAANIETSGRCTYKEINTFYSARRETISTGRMGSFIALL